jgi:hypothetical protein
MLSKKSLSVGGESLIEATKNSIRSDENSSKLIENSTKTDENSIKSDENSTQLLENSTKSDENSIKSDENSIKSDKSSIKSDKNSAKSAENSIKSDENSIKLIDPAVSDPELRRARQDVDQEEDDRIQASSRLSLAATKSLSAGKVDVEQIRNKSKNLRLVKSLEVGHPAEAESSGVRFSDPGRQ